MCSLKAKPYKYSNANVNLWNIWYCFTRINLEQDLFKLVFVGCSIKLQPIFNSNLCQLFSFTSKTLLIGSKFTISIFDDGHSHFIKCFEGGNIYCKILKHRFSPCKTCSQVFSLSLLGRNSRWTNSINQLQWQIGNVVGDDVNFKFGRCHYKKSHSHYEGEKRINKYKFYLHTRVMIL